MKTSGDVAENKCVRNSGRNLTNTTGKKTKKKEKNK